MAKKIVRGITDVKTINNQDLNTNNVNDLLSDGQYNYIHRKKGKSEEYHNLTDNIKTLFSDNTELLAVTNNNKTNNTATLHPKHDAQKEQVLESTRNTISIHHGTNGTAEKTTVDTNPQKVLEHTNLLTDYGISKNTTGNTTKLGLEYTKADNFDLNELVNGRIRGANLLNAPSNAFYFVESFTEDRYCIQEATQITDYINTTYKRLKYNGVWGAWREQVGDKSVIDDSLAQKQNTLTSNESIAVLSNNQLRQTFTSKNYYTHTNGCLKTHTKSLCGHSTPYTPVEEFNFILKINQGTQKATFTLNEGDKTHFSKLITAYGVDSSVLINGCLFTLSSTTLTVSTDANTGSNLLITFSDILD